MSSALYRTRDQDHGLDAALDCELIEACDAAISEGRRVELERPFAMSTVPSGPCSARWSRGATAARAFPMARSRSPLGARRAKAFAPCAQRHHYEALRDTNDYLGKGLSAGPSHSSRRNARRSGQRIRSSRATSCCTGHLGLGLHPRAGRRTILRPQLGRLSCCRGSGRPRVRVHDRWHGARARTDGTQLRGRDVWRLGLRARPGHDVPRRLNPRWSSSNSSTRRTGDRSASSATRIPLHGL